MQYLKEEDKMKIWAKLIDEENRLCKDTVYETECKFNYEEYPEILRGIAYALDIPTPLVMKSHFSHIKRFRIHKYKQSDFVEFLGYKALELEICPE